MQLRAPCALPFDPTWFAYVWAAPRSMAEEDRHKEATAAARVEREAPDGAAAMEVERGEGRGRDTTPVRGKKTGKAKRRQKRLRNEPQSVSGEQMPIAINVLDFAEARATELKNMTIALQAKPSEGGRRVFQQLPRHMRRRAMSHNVRRLPRRLQEKAAREMEKQLASKDPSKKKSRKQRRKPRNLREETARRQREHVWLETHVWHAKRMHMMDHYGYRVAERNNDKGVRQAYRSLRYGCLLSDISYHCCVQLEGERDDIISCLSPLFNSDTGLTVASQPYASGSRAGCCVMYHANRYPYGAIGPVQFLWQPSGANNLCNVGGATYHQTGSSKASQSSSDNPSTAEIVCGNSGQTGVNTGSKPVSPAEKTVTKLWLVTSPAIHNEVMAEVSTAVETFVSRFLPPPPSSGECIHSMRDAGGENETSDSTQTCFSTTKPLILEHVSENESLGAVSCDSGVIPKHALCVTSLKDEFVRFRLIGPRSHALVMETLKPVVEPVSDEVGAKTTASQPDLSRIPIPIPWWNGDTTLHNHTQSLNKYIGSLRDASSPADFPEGTLLGMVVQDPRLFTPSKKTDMVSSHYPSKKKWWVEKFVQCAVGDVGEGGGVGGGLEEEEFVSGARGMEGEVEVGREGGGEGGSGEVSDGKGDLGEKDTDSDSEGETTSVNQTEEESCRGDLSDRLKSISCKDIPPELAYSPLWDACVRRTVAESRVPDHVLNDVRANVLAKAPILHLGDKSPRIPVMLIRQAYSSSHVDGVLQLGGGGCHGYHSGMSQSVTTSSESGWDLVLPSNWAMAFWVALVYRGARACGTTEMQKCYLECGMPSFPLDFPDTLVGREYAAKKRREVELKYCRYPPDKRRNYGKLLIQDQFVCPWEGLVREWQTRNRIDRLLYDRVLCASMVAVATKSGKKREEREGESGFDSGEETELDIAYVAEPPHKRPRLDGSAGGKECERKINEDLVVLPQHVDGASIRVGPEDNKEESKPNQVLSSDCDSYYVLRSKSALLKLSHFFSCLGSSSLQSHSGTACGPQQPLSFQAILKQHGVDQLLTEHSRALVGVCFEMLCRGNATPHSIVSVPTSADLRELSTNLNFHGPEEAICPKGMTVVDGDTVCVGVSSLTRKKMDEVKAERKQRSKETRTSEKKFGVIDKQSKEEVTTQLTRDFSLQPAIQSRLIIGYSTTAGYRLSSSMSGGIAFCSVAGLLEAARQSYDFRAFGGDCDVGEGGKVGEGGGVNGEGVTSGVGVGVRGGGGDFVMGGGGEGVSGKGVEGGVGEGVRRGEGVRGGGGEGVRRGEGVEGGVGEGVRRGKGVKGGVGEGVRRGEGVRGGSGDGARNRGGVRQRDCDLLLLVRSESVHHRFARFTLLHSL